MIRHRETCVLSLVFTAVLFLGSAAGAEKRVFDLEEVSTYDVAGQIPPFAQGHSATCAKEPSPDVRAYPALKSDKPVYGWAQFGSFFEEVDPALLYHFVADESGGPATGYDRLYVDANGDRDLSNDAPVSPRKDVPGGLFLRYTSIVGQVLFEDVGIPLPRGSEGFQPMMFTPRLLLIKGGGAMFSFVPAKARRGRIEIEGQKYDVILGQTYPVCGWFDHPETGYCLMGPIRPDAKTPQSGVGALMTMLRVGETHYRFAASPAGDKLTVRPYEGPMGELEIGGGHKFETADLAVVGSLQSRDAVIGVTEAKSQIPAGDYFFGSMEVSRGALRFAISRNDHTDGGFRSRLYHLPAYPIHIREGERFLLDFTNPSRIIFADPPKDHRVKLGERMFVEAVLADSVLDFVVSNFSVAPQPPADGAPQPAGTSARVRRTVLNPSVTISRSNGEVVDEGVMSYG